MYNASVMYTFVNTSKLEVTINMPLGECVSGNEVSIVLTVNSPLKAVKRHLYERPVCGV